MRASCIAAALATLALAACTAPPPPAAATAPHDVGRYLLYFEFDDVRLNSAALTSIASAARDAVELGSRVCITTHTDRAGSDAYNMDLSRRRAEVVRDEMVRLGVPIEKISMLSRGESQPVVMTKDAVREPQNRRAEVHVWCDRYNDRLSSNS